MLSATDQNSSQSVTAPKVDDPSDKRRIQRISLPLPVRIEVKIDTETSWNEITRLGDVSAFGAGFLLKRPLKRGRMILLTIPMPRQLRSYDFSEPQYKTWANVRRCIAVQNANNTPEYSIGVAFTGKNAPNGFLEHPSKLYDVGRRDHEGDGFWNLYPVDVTADERDLPNDLRKQTRFFIPEPLLVERVDEAGNVLQSENTVTENISLGGASIFTSLSATKGTFLRVTSERFDVTILSVVRGQRIGQDGITRLHVEFIDKYFPLEGIVSM